MRKNLILALVFCCLIVLTCKETTAKEHPFVQAIIDGDKATVEKFLQTQPRRRYESVISKGRHGATPLHLAAQYNQLEIIKLLADPDLEIDEKDDNWQTALHYAAREGNIEAVELLLQKGADINSATITGWQAIHEAAINNRTAVVDQLLKRGVSADVRTGDGETLLHLAGGVETAKLLVDRGLTTSATDKNGRTPLFSARTPEIARFLLDNGADPAIKDKGQRTPMDAAIEDNRIDVAQFLESRGVSSSVITGESVHLLNTVTERGHPSQVEFILSHGVNINTADDKGNTPLFFANTPEMARFLLDKGADVKVRNKKGETPLFHAVRLDNPEIIQLYLDRGVDINAAAGNDETVLHIAAARNPEVLKLLLDKKVRVDTKLAKNLQTPLFIAVLKGNTKNVQLLVKAGADVNARDSSGATPLKYAKANKRQDVVQFLRQHGAHETISGTTLVIFILISVFLGANAATNCWLAHVTDTVEKEGKTREKADMPAEVTGETTSGSESGEPENTPPIKA